MSYNRMIDSRLLEDAIDRACHNVIVIESDPNTSNDRRRECQAMMYAYGVVKIMVEELKKTGKVTYL